MVLDPRREEVAASVTLTSVSMTKQKREPQRVRRTQEERSATTRALLLDATIDCLHELGYAGTTTTEIADRAGVSRGAQLHHFPTKQELVGTAVSWVLDRRLEEFKKAWAALPDGSDRASAAIDLLWQATSGPAFYAWLELLVAARTDPSLRKIIQEISIRFSQGVVDTFHEAFPDVRGLDMGPWFALATLQGIALERIVVDDDPRVPMGLAILKGITSRALTPRK
jgi:AcrR family transcriptional regulator